jgi:hypothetical protein
MRARFSRTGLLAARLAALGASAAGLAAPEAAAARADPQFPCQGCQLAVGVGGTYDYFDKTSGIVLPVMLDFRNGRWELGAFRFTTAQYLEPRDGSSSRRFSSPYWGASLSRRWGLWARPSVRVFVGLGASWKSARDELNSSQWNFAEQLGVRWRLSSAWALELTLRHWSNAGIRLPNRGQDFATLTLVF